MATTQNGLFVCLPQLNIRSKEKLVRVGIKYLQQDAGNSRFYGILLLWCMSWSVWNLHCWLFPGLRGEQRNMKRAGATLYVLLSCGTRPPRSMKFALSIGQKTKLARASTVLAILTLVHSWKADPGKWWPLGVLTGMVVWTQTQFGCIQDPNVLSGY